MKSSVLKKRREKLVRRQHRLLHEVAGVYGADYQELLGQCAVRMREHGLTPDVRLDEAMVRRVLET